MKAIGVFTSCMILTIGVSLPVKSADARMYSQTATQRTHFR